MKNRLKELRINRGLSQKNLINEFNLFLEKNLNKYVGQREIRQVTSATESRWENGSITIPTIYLDSLADFFGVTVSYLLGPSSRKQIKNRIREVRKARGLRLEEVGEAIGVQGNTICRYEKGNREPSSELWQKLADCFDVSVPYLQGYPFAKCHWCGNEFVLADEKDRDRYFYCPYCERSPLDFGDKKDTLDDAIGFLNELIGTGESLTNVGKAELTKVVRVLYNIYYDDTHACWKTK